MGVQRHHLESRFFIIGRNKRNRYKMLSSIRVIRITHRGNRADRDGCIPQAEACLELLQRFTDALRRANDNSGVVELTFCSIAVKRTTHQPPFNDNEDERKDRNKYIQGTRHIQMEQVAQCTEHNEVDKGRIQQLGI